VGKQKMREPARDKRLRPDGDKAKREMETLAAQVQAAQQLLSSEEADGIIGEADDEYRALIQAARAVTTMQWMMARGQGARETPAALRMQAQSMIIVLDLVHKAYALGVRRGEQAR
jgi:hypothetical protein